MQGGALSSKISEAHLKQIEAFFVKDLTIQKEADFLPKLSAIFVVEAVTITQV